MEFELNGFEYRVQKLNARAQYHIMRRLTPMLAELASAVNAAEKADDALSPLANALARMTDADADYCLFGLLQAVKRKQNGAWSKVALENALMFDDLDLATMLQLAFKAFQFNFASFFQSVPQALRPWDLQQSAQ